MLPFKILQQEKFEAIKLSEAKDQCRVVPSHTRDDDYIESIIAASADAAQEYINWMVSNGTVQQYSPNCGSMILYGRYITSITEITALDSTGNEVTLTTDDYSYNAVTEEVTIPTGYSEVFVTYECGASVNNLPASVRHGILMLISTMYNNRENFITGLTVAKMPLTSHELLNKVRTYVS